ncbi:MAG: efflux RND transporter periplasmic adaptor subunit, partial [Alphaproteobacteria bacterium]
MLDVNRSGGSVRTPPYESRDRELSERRFSLCRITRTQPQEFSSPMCTTKIEFSNAPERRGGFSRLIRRSPPAMRAAAGAMMLICGLAASAVAQQPGPSSVPVGTVTAERKPIAQMADFVGRIQAIERVDIQARITGYLEQVLFKEGDTVKEGQPLYRIEKDLFKAEVDQAEGALEASKAKKLLTAIQYE